MKSLTFLTMRLRKIINTEIFKCNDISTIYNIFIRKMYFLKTNTPEISNNDQSYAGLNKHHDITFNQI